MGEALREGSSLGSRVSTELQCQGRLPLDLELRTRAFRGQGSPAQHTITAFPLSHRACQRRGWGWSGTGEKKVVNNKRANEETRTNEQGHKPLGPLCPH